MYDNVWLCMTMFDNKWLCMPIYDYVWLCMTMYDYVWLCMIMYDYVWLCQKCRLTFTATAHATCPLEYHSKDDLRSVMIYIVEPGNKTPHVIINDWRQIYMEHKNRYW